MRKNKEIDIKALEKVIGRDFSNKGLLLQAVTHRSFTNEQKDAQHNERLEFLGDTVLQFITTRELYTLYPEVSEGTLSAYRSLLVKTDFLVQVAENLNMRNFVRVSAGQERDLENSPVSLLADVIEALIGAVYLDGGMDAAEQFVFNYVLTDIKDYLAKTPTLDSKTMLQERIQQEQGITPRYVVLSEEGPDHDKMFEVGVKVGDTLISKGAGKTKQGAAQEAAKNALSKQKGKKKK